MEGFEYQDDKKFFCPWIDCEGYGCVVFLTSIITLIYSVGSLLPKGAMEFLFFNLFFIMKKFSFELPILWKRRLVMIEISVDLKRFVRPGK